MKILRILFSTSLFLVITTTLNAEMYKHTDADGVVTFSDKEVPGSTLVVPRPGNTVTLPKYTAKKPKDKPVDKGYRLFTIVSPENDTIFNDNTGSIPVIMTLDPELDATEGHSITLYLNGQIVSEKGATLNTTIENIDRGSHTLYAVIFDSAKKSLIQSNSVTVHVKRYSSLH